MFPVHFCFFAAIRLAPPILCKRLDVLVSKVGQAMEKIFKNFSGFCFTTLKGGILLLLFYQTQQKLFLLRLGI
jgi:hypothetical protein